MVTQKVVVKNKSGLHMRPAGIFAKSAASFDSAVNFSFNGTIYNAKSLLRVISATVKCGDEIELRAEGADQEECIKTLTELVESGLGE